MGNLKISKNSVEVVNLDFATGSILNKLKNITEIEKLNTNSLCVTSNCYNCNEVRCSDKQCSNVQCTQVKCTQVKCTQVKCNNVTVQCSDESDCYTCNCDCGDCKD